MSVGWTKVLFVCLLGAPLGLLAEATDSQGKAESRDGPYLVSLVRLIATPEKFAGLRVQVIGYLGKPLQLYLTEKHAEVEDFWSGIEIFDPSEDGSLTRSSCVGNWVKVTGTLYRRQNGLYALWPVERVQLLDSYGICWTGGGPSEP